MPLTETLEHMSIRSELHKPRRHNGHHRRWPHVERRHGHEEFTPLVEIDASEVDTLLTDLGENIEESHEEYDEHGRGGHHEEEHHIRTYSRFNREPSGQIADMWTVRSGKAP